MRIALLCLPRTGSTNIRKYFENVNTHYKVYNEPFNPPIEPHLTWPIETYNNVLLNENVFVKGIFWHIPNELSNLSIYEFYDKLKEDFDKIIILKRKDIINIAKSVLHAQTYDSWHKQYIVNKIDDTALNHTLNYIEQKTTLLNELIELHNFSVYYYEDVFYNKELMIDFLNDINCGYNEVAFNKFLRIENKYSLEKPKVKPLI